MRRIDAIRARVEPVPKVFLIGVPPSDLALLLASGDALRDLLQWAERFRTYGWKINPEEWYVVRDAATAALAPLLADEGET